jgi:hypothetical protein
MHITLNGGPNDGDRIFRADDMKPLPEYIWTDGIPGHVTIYLGTLYERHLYQRVSAIRYQYLEKCIVPIRPNLDVH